MRYQEYLLINKTYVLFHTEGVGVMECPIIEGEMLGAYDTYAEAEAEGIRRYPRDGSGWDYHSWTININISTPEGQEKYAEFKEQCEKRTAYIEANPDKFITYKGEGFNITMEYNASLDGPKK